MTNLHQQVKEKIEACKGFSLIYLLMERRLKNQARRIRKQKKKAKKKRT